MEKWKIINNYFNYEVSNMGNIRNIKTKKLLKFISHKGYNRVGLYNDFNKKQKIFTVHRLVAEAFIPNPYNKPQVHHRDSVRNNNIISNLEWVTQSENEFYKPKNGKKLSYKFLLDFYNKKANFLNSLSIS